MRKAVVSTILVVALIIYAGCGATITNKGKAAMMLSTYRTFGEQTIKDADSCVARGDACIEAERQMIRNKKAVLVKLDPLVVTFGSLVDNNVTPPASQEQAIYDLIDELVGLGL